MTVSHRTSLAGLLAAMLVWTPVSGQELADPIEVRAAGQPIDVASGHAAPFAFDWDGDGVLDLLVGQFGDGRLRIYRNVGTNEQPQFEDYEYFEAGGQTARIPVG